MITQIETTHTVLNNVSVLTKLSEGPLLLVQNNSLDAVLISPLQWNALLDELLELRRESDRTLTYQVEQLVEARWDRLFEQSQDMLADWANEALAEHDTGQTEPIETFLSREEVPEKVFA